MPRRPRWLSRVRAIHALKRPFERGPIPRRFPSAARRARERLDRWTVYSPEKMHEFWTQPAPPGCPPETFIEPVGRSQALARLIADIPKDSRILEIGCGVGRNLAYLHDLGYASLAGNEISPRAVEVLRETYPSLGDVPVSVGPAETELARLDDDSFDLVFTMSLLLAIHPDCTEVFDHMARVGREILTIEPDHTLGVDGGQAFGARHYYAHDVPAMFGARGFDLVEKTRMEDFPEADEALNGYVALRFVTRASAGPVEEAGAQSM